MIFVVSAPSGAGKRTVLDQVRAADPMLAYSVSATTRAPRPGEIEGKDYYFLDRAEFERRVAAGEFAEWAEVHGNLYGTLRAEFARIETEGRDVLVEIDVQGMRKLKAAGVAFASIFIVPPSMEELERRLRGRGTDSEEQIALRLRNAREEWRAEPEYDITVVNDRVEDAVTEVKAFMEQRRRAQA